MKIIDFRMRPPLGSFLQSRIYAAADNRNRYTRSLGFEPPASAERQSIDLLLEEMGAAGIARGVVVGRNSPTLGVIPNDDVVAMCARYPDRFVPVGSIDPTNRNTTRRLDKRSALAHQHALEAQIADMQLWPYLSSRAPYLELWQRVKARAGR